MTTEHKRPAPDETPSDDILAIGQSMSRMRVMMGRRVIGRMALASAAPELDLSQLDILEVVRRIERDGGEATVGAIAEAMRLDPSRGSRLVADLVGSGHLRRQACQDDGRRSIIRLTRSGETLMADIRALKHSIIDEITGTWPTQDRQNFGRLFSQFMDGFEQAFQNLDKTG